MSGATGRCSPDTQPPTAPAHSGWGHLSAGQNKNAHSGEEQGNKIKGERAEHVLFSVYLESAAVDYGSSWFTQFLQHVP